MPELASVAPGKRYDVAIIGYGPVGATLANLLGQAGLGLTPAQVGQMLLLAGWLPSVALAVWQMRHRCWRALIASDLLGAGLLVLLACTAYLPLFFFHVAWFLPLALLPRGLLAELLDRLLARLWGA